MNTAKAHGLEEYTHSYETQRAKPKFQVSEKISVAYGGKRKLVPHFLVLKNNQ